MLFYNTFKKTNCDEKKIEGYLKKMFPRGIPKNREQGGTITLNRRRLYFREIKNYSTKKNEFTFFLSKKTLKSIQGFWHTHPTHFFPGLLDILQVIKLNIRYRKNFYLIIFHNKGYSIINFYFYIFPLIKIVNTTRN